MSNPFDKKIKESLEGFEMPYDAGAWSALEKDLPTTPSAGNGFGWKAAAIVAIAVTTIATVLYLNGDTETIAEQTPVVEKVETAHSETQKETIAQQKTVLSEKKITPVVNETIEPVAQHISENGTTEPIGIGTSEETTTDKTPAAELVTDTKTDKKAEAISDDQKITETPQTEDRPFTVSFIANTLDACVGETVSFINESSDRTVTMSWDFGDGSTSYETDPVHSYEQSGNYTVFLSGMRNNKGEGFSTTVTVKTAPTPQLSASRKLEGFEAIPLYRFSTILQPDETAVWSFSDGTQIEGNAAEHLFREAGKSTAKLTVKNELGCATTIVKRYTNTKKFDLLAPTGFTPDGNGDNETFFLPELQYLDIAFELTIKDARTSTIVYRTSDPQGAWNGRMNNNGSKLESGLYYWTVILKENVVKNKVFTNTISLQP